MKQVYDVILRMIDGMSYDVPLGGKEVAEWKEIDIGWKCPPCSWSFPRGSVPPRRLAAHSKLIPSSSVQPDHGLHKYFLRKSGLASRPVLWFMRNYDPKPVGPCQILPVQVNKAAYTGYRRFDKSMVAF